MSFRVGIRAAAKDRAPELYIYDEIGGWGADPVTIGTVRARLAEIGDAPELTVRISSGGGDVNQGMAVYGALREFAGRKTVIVEGLAASIASVIAMAGDEVVMTRESYLMVHNPWGFVQGGSEDLRRTADLLDSMRERMLDIYQAKSKQERSVLEALVDAETYMTAEDALAKGFVDRVTDTGARMAASITSLKNAPEALRKNALPRAEEKTMTEEEIAKMKADLKAAQEECASLKDKLAKFEKEGSDDDSDDDDKEDEDSEESAARASVVAAAIKVTGEQDVRKLSAKVLALTASAPLGRRATVEKAVADGVLPPGMKSWAMSAPRAALDSFLASAKVTAGPRAAGSPEVRQPPVKEDAAPKSKLTELERELMAKMNRTEDQMIAARAVVLKNHPTAPADD